MRFLFVCLALALFGGGAAYYATDGQMWGLAERARLAMQNSAPKADRAAKSEPQPQGKSGPSPRVVVEAATAVSTTSTEDLRGIGTLQSDESVQLASEIAGRVTEIALSEGTQVTVGDVLIRLDNALAVAEVSDAQARFILAQGNLDRANSLAKSGNVTERARDEATTNAETSRAALELSKVRLSKHVIRAPFSGIAGIRTVSPGAYVTAGQPLVNVEKIDKLKIDFKLPEIYLSQIKTGQQIEITVDALPGQSFAGTIYAIDPHIDVNGRALSIRARLENPKLILRPGLFARIRVKGQVKRNVLVIPEAAIVPRGEDKIVFTVRDGQAVEAKVKLGGRDNGMVEVLDGLAADSMVVTAGQQKLRDGSRVEILLSGSPAARGS